MGSSLQSVMKPLFDWKATQTFIAEVESLPVGRPLPQSRNMDR